MSKVSDSLKIYFKNKKISNIEIAERLGKSPTNVALLLSGKRDFRRRNAHDWAEAFGFSEEWLKTGEGNMFPDSSVSYDIEGLQRQIREKDAEIAMLRQEYQNAVNKFIDACEKFALLIPTKGENNDSANNVQTQENIAL